MNTTFHRIPQELGIKILRKYEYTCQQCKVTSDLVVHHKQRVDEGHPLFVDETNLTVLCRSCHMKHHRLNGEIPTSKFVGAPKGSCNNPYGRRGTRHEIICMVEDCVTVQHAKGLCKMHYARKHRHKWVR